MRLIKLDTETTGFSPDKGGRICEIGLVEVVDFVKTGRTFHAYFNPQSKMNWAAQKVHGLSDRFLADKPLFASLCDEILDFIGESPTFAHNARFDRGFVLNEMQLAGRDCRTAFIDTIPMAGAIFGKKAKLNLDNVVRMLDLPIPPRGKHGALLDADILADVVIAMERRMPGLTARALQSPLSGIHRKANLSQLRGETRTSINAGPPARTSLPSPAGQDLARLKADLEKAYGEAVDFQDFVARAQAEGITMNAVTKDQGTVFSGFRFIRGEVNVTGSEAGMKGDRFRSGPLAYDRARDAKVCAELQNGYRRHISELVNEETGPSPSPF